MTLNFPQNDWYDKLKPTFEKPEIKTLFKNLDFTYQLRASSLLPEKKNLFKAFELTPYSETKVVILGQDPYPDPNQAMGLSFSVPKGEKIPRSLKNIYKERKNDLGIDIPNHGDLSLWAKRGVLLLNTVLTNESGKRNAHKNLGWNLFTDDVIQALNEKETPPVYLLWGAQAQAYLKQIKYPEYCLCTSHPSPLGAAKTNQPFLGSQLFSRTNQLLTQLNQSPIDWSN